MNPWLMHLAWRNLNQHRLRTTLSALAVAFGVATTVAADMTQRSILNALAENPDAERFMVGLIDELGSVLVQVGAAITLAAGLLVLNAFAMAVTQRRQHIGMLRSLGMTRRQVLQLMLVEGIWVGAIGTALGLVGGPLLGRGVVGLARSLVGHMFLFAPSRAAPSVLLLAVGLGMGVTLAAVLLPAWWAARVAPLQALRQPAAAGLDGGSLRWTLLGSGIVLALLVLLLVSPPGEWAMPPWDYRLTLLFAMLWLAGLASVVPALVGGFGRGLQEPLTRLWGATGRLVADHLRRGRGRVTLTVLSLLLGVAMIAGMTGLIGFLFRELLLPRTEQARQQRVWLVTPADFVSGMAGLSQASSLSLPLDAVAAVEELSRERATVLEWHFVVVPELSFFGTRYFTFALDPYAARAAGEWVIDFTEGNWESALPMMEAGCGVLMMPALAQRQGVGLGDTLEVTGVEGPVQCTVAGIGSTYVGATILNASAGALFGSTQPAALLVLPGPGANWEALGRDLAAALEPYPSLYLEQADRLMEAQTGMMEAIPNLFNALLLLAIAAAALGVVNTTMLSVAERRREMGLLRAVGATRRQVRAVVVGEAALIGALGGALGVLAGAGLVVILALVYGGNGWGMPDLDLWAAAGRALRPALVNGLLGLAAAPVICGGAVWLATRGADTLNVPG